VGLDMALWSPIRPTDFLRQHARKSAGTGSSTRSAPSKRESVLMPGGSTAGGEAVGAIVDYLEHGSGTSHARGARSVTTSRICGV